ncbi:MAG TPA: hypothetical protein DCZ11_03235 [Gammaproteobacteria bacterium]|jgi:hypothetical protein|nr:hypothetical protein [Gammaproteobacteria bacterium]MCH77440.1 hypothetical protein [Gammaproteobacteria bacterium]
MNSHEISQAPPRGRDTLEAILGKDEYDELSAIAYLYRKEPANDAKVLARWDDLCTKIANAIASHAGPQRPGTIPARP